MTSDPVWDLEFRWYPAQRQVPEGWQAEALLMGCHGAYSRLIWRKL